MFSGNRTDGTGPGFSEKYPDRDDRVDHKTSSGSPESSSIGAVRYTGSRRKQATMPTDEADYPAAGAVISARSK